MTENISVFLFLFLFFFFAALSQRPNKRKRKNRDKNKCEKEITHTRKRRCRNELNSELNRRRQRFEISLQHFPLWMEEKTVRWGLGFYRGCWNLKWPKCPCASIKATTGPRGQIRVMGWVSLRSTNTAPWV